MILTIIGKQPLQDPPKLPNWETLGLNEAAIWYNTTYAITGHGVILSELHKAFKGDIIAINPLFEGKEPKNVKFILKYDEIEARNEDISTEYARKYIRFAKDNADIGYPNRLSILHLAIFWAIKEGYTELNLVGCAQDYDKIDDASEFNREAAPIMREFTKSIIDASKKEGIKINWVLSKSKQFEEKKVIPMSVDLSILNLQGYFDKHFKLLQNSANGDEAWMKLEKEYFALTNRYRYKTYEYFRIAKHRYYKNY